MSSGTAARALLLIGLLLATLPSAVGAPAAAPATPAPFVGVAASHASSFVHPPGLRWAPGAIPLVSTPFYTQVGGTMSQMNGSTSITGLKSLSLRLTVVNSPYSTGFELNGVSSTGDWYQVLVGDNWPGCPGFEMLFEVWANTGAGFAPGCDSSLTIRAGDQAQLGLNFTGGGNVCMDLWDLSRFTERVICTAQPDSGATQFDLLSSSANSNGYFTGPMTEIINSTATACPDYTIMPHLSYVWPPTEHVTAYQVWSDEFGYGASICYSAGTGDSIATGDPTVHAFDTASGTSYGPHYVAGQNLSMINASAGFRLETDPTPLTGVALTAGANQLLIDDSTILRATVTGGYPPYQALWTLNGTIGTVGPTSRNFSSPAPGTFRFTAYGVDAAQQVVGPSNLITLQVSGILTARGLAVNTTSGGADVGQPVRLSVSVAGGITPYTFVWGGLPSECPGSNSAAVLCTPDHPSAYEVTVTVDDANHSSVVAGPLSFAVASALTPSIQLSAAAVDLNQSLRLGWSVSGGAGGTVAAFRGLPPGCATPISGSGVCTPTTSGTFPLSLSVVDANGANISAPSRTLVVYPYLIVGLSINRNILDAGNALTFTATALGGSGVTTFTWSGLPDGCLPANLSKITCLPSSSGTFGVQATGVDTLGGTSTSGAATFYVAPALQLNLTGAATAVVGGLLRLSANVSGGSGGVVLRWIGLPAGCLPPTGTALECTPTTAGSYNVTVIASDSAGGAANATRPVVVGSPNSGGGGAGPSIATSWVILGVVGIVAVVGIAAVLAARRRR